MKINLSSEDLLSTLYNSITEKKKNPTNDQFRKERKKERKKEWRIWHKIIVFILEKKKFDCFFLNFNLNVKTNKKHFKQKTYNINYLQ